MYTILIVGSSCLSFSFFFVVFIPYVVDACALPSILPSLSVTNMMFCTPEMKLTSASASNIRLIWISLPHVVVKRVRNSTARFHCVFGRTDGPLNVRRISEDEFCKFWVSLG
jgi:hypothetical protein